jgi:hypothetical protein
MQHTDLAWNIQAREVGGGGRVTPNKGHIWQMVKYGRDLGIF